MADKESAATPLELAPESLRGNRRVYLKREDRHPLGAFKWRGALPTLRRFKDRGASGVVTASTGNHGAATAWAGRQLAIPVTVFAPTSATRAKLALIEREGASIRLVGSDFDEAKDEARRFAAGEGLPFFEDGNEPEQYEGYSSIGREIREQCPERISSVIVPVGNGALIAGVAMGLREDPETEKVVIVAVAAREAPVMALSFEAHGAVVCDRMATFADGLAARVAVPRAVEAVNRVVDRFVLVSEREIARALGAYAAAGIRTEGAAAAALAALAKIEDSSGALVLVVTGRNIDEELFRRACTNPESFPD